jgi:hypothetical protein
MIANSALYCTKGPFITFLSTLFPILLLVNAFIYSLFSLSLALINSLILFLKLTKPASLVLYPQNACVNHLIYKSNNGVCLSVQVLKSRSQKSQKRNNSSLWSWSVGTRAWSSLSFLSVAREGKGLGTG